MASSGRLSSRRGAGETGFPAGIQPYAKSSHFKWEEVAEKGTDGWLLPGQGEAYPTCGTYYIKGCLEHDPAYFKRVKYNCARAECPVDYRAWLARATEKMVRRIEAGRPSKHRNAIHVSMSPPRSEWHNFETKKGYLKQRRKALSLAKKAGLIGGCLIFHPYRETDSKQWYFSPHFHVMGFGWIQWRGLYAKTGWIVKNHRVRKTIGGTAYYQASHAGVKAGHHVISWFGILSWKSLQEDPADYAEPETCPVCGGILRLVHWCGPGEHPMVKQLIHWHEPEENPNKEPEELYMSSAGWRYHSWR